ncbi:hypothetical protein [Aquimarina addita]
MKKKPSILVAFLSAAITFGSLYAFVGKPKFTKHFRDCHHKEVNHQLDR